MGLSKAISKIFSGPENDEAVSRGASQYRSRVRSPVRWFRSKSRSRERPTISAPVALFPKLPRGAEIFDAQVTTASLSQILIWYIYYDVAKPARKGSKWWQHLPWDVLVGWIALGRELARSKNFPSKGLKSACDEMGLDTREVVMRLVRLCDGQAMLKSELFMLDYLAKAAKFQCDLRLIQDLRPIPETKFESWRNDIISCISDYLDLVIRPVTEVGEHEVAPADNDAEIKRRNAARRRLEKLTTTSRDALPEDLYSQAEQMASDTYVLAVDNPRISPHRIILHADRVDGGSSPCCQTQSTKDHTRRHSAPIWESLTKEIEAMKLQLSRMEENNKRSRYSNNVRDDSLAIGGRVSSHQDVSPPRGRTCSNMVQVQAFSQDGHDPNSSHRLYINKPQLTNERLSEPADVPRIHHLSKRIIETNAFTAAEAGEQGQTPPASNYSGRSRRPSRGHSPSHPPHIAHAIRLEAPSAQPMIRDLDALRSRLLTHQRTASDTALALPKSRQQQWSNTTDRRRFGHAENRLQVAVGVCSPTQSHPAIPSPGYVTGGPSFMTSPYPEDACVKAPAPSQKTLRAITERSFMRMPARLAERDLLERKDSIVNPDGEHGSPKHALNMNSQGTSGCMREKHRNLDLPTMINTDSSASSTPPSSPSPSLLMLNRLQGIPGAWPVEDEARSTRTGSAADLIPIPASRYAPSVGTAAGWTDITDPGELTDAQAIRYQTRWAMANMVDINNSNQNQSPPSLHGDWYSDVYEDECEENLEGGLQ